MKKGWKTSLSKWTYGTVITMTICNFIGLSTFQTMCVMLCAIAAALFDIATTLSKILDNMTANKNKKHIDSSMKKMMFNSFYRLNDSVLTGRKTQTRRNFTLKLSDGTEIESVSNVDGEWRYTANGQEYNVPKQNYPKYDVGDIVAVAQSYKDIYESDNAYFSNLGYDAEELKKTAGWTNKMFVKAELMPHQIQITEVRAQRLQDISDADCIAEGVILIDPKCNGGKECYYPCKHLKSNADKIGWGRVYDTPRQAYAALINKISGEGTWEKNPYVYAYTFNLIK